MNIVILDGYAANPGDLSWDRFKTLGDLTVYPRSRREEVVERAHDAEIILTNKVSIDDELMGKLPKLRYIGVLATGYNIIDTQAARKRGIVVTNIPAYSTMSVAQMVIAHLLNITNQVALHSDAVKQGEWQRNKDFSFSLTPLIELDGKTLGIVGLGNIGSRVAAIANAFGMKVMAYTSKEASLLPPYIHKGTMAEVLEQSDVVSLHCPLTDNTHHLICRDTLKLMKPTAILINTGRGPLVCEEDVAEALNAGSLYAYCADVLSKEPAEASNPLLKCPAAYITPHIAWATEEARRRLVDVAVNNVCAFVDGTPQNVISA